MNTIDISKLSKLERLQAIEALWDSLIHEAPEIESPEWHRDILARRKRKVEAGEAEFNSVEELRSKHSG